MSALDGRVAVVTGGSRGIGRAIAIALSRKGARVALSFREKETLGREVESLLRSEGREAVAFRCDVASPEDVSAFFRSVESALGPVDVLVNNAAVAHDGLFIFMEPAKWDHVLSVNLDGAYRCTREVARGMMVRRWGRVINIVSLSGIMGVAGQANYSASKAGLIGLTLSLSRELAPHGILVNAVVPGLIETDLIASMPREALEKHLERIPLGRVGTPEEVASLVSFLATEDASYISGQVIGVTGGFLG